MHILLASPSCYRSHNAGFRRSPPDVRRKKPATTVGGLGRPPACRGRFMRGVAHFARGYAPTSSQLRKIKHTHVAGGPGCVGVKDSPQN